MWRKIIIKNSYFKDKNGHKIKDYCHYKGEYRGVASSICILKYNVLEKNTIVFHSGSNYDYQYIINKLAEEFKKKLLVSEKTLKNT